MRAKGIILLALLAALAVLPALGADGMRGSVFPEDAAPVAGDVARETDVATFFSPDGGARRAIVAEINGAREEILVAMYTFTSAEIAESLIRARERGVQVRVMLDEGQRIRGGANGRQSARLIESGIEVRFDSVSGLMHNKFAVIDRRLVITGSYNWTAGAEERNFENLLVIRSSPIAERYAEEFDAIKSRCAPAG